MSYSFSVKAASKAGAKAAVAKYFDEQVIANQPVHARDRAAVLANAGAVIDLLADDETKDIQCSGNGYVSCPNTGDPNEVPLASASITASAGYVNRE
jgi:diadenosine tetraphosphatase ApaH/serine/threonine PP2A family protein phosphatase